MRGHILPTKAWYILLVSTDVVHGPWTWGGAVEPRGVVENWPLPLLWLLAFTTACSDRDKTLRFIQSVCTQIINGACIAQLLSAQFKVEHCN